MKAWCDECGRETSRYPGGKCRTCASRKVPIEERRKWQSRGASTTNTKRTSEQRREDARKGAFAMIAKHGSPFRNPEIGRRGGLKGGRVANAGMTWDPSQPWKRYSSGPQNLEEALRVLAYIKNAERPFEERCAA
jgi:hypothetical protein